jgi:LuxR family maltose regulon positive regulatory protein
VDHTSAPFSLLQTKLLRPPVPQDLVTRRWLLDLLGQNLPRPLTVISAPAGYGKTTLMAHWLQNSEWPSAWVALDEYDDDLRSFVTYFVAALQTLFPEAGQETLARLNPNELPPARALAVTLINELNAIQQPFILVVDDYHLVHDLAVHDVLIELLKHPPTALHLVLITRIDPPLNLVTLAARNQVLILRAQDLRFLPAEATAFLRQGSGRLLSDAEVAHLVQQAEGWAAGLRLLCIAQQRPAPAGEVSAFRRSSKRLAIDYLFAEALQQQPQAVQEVLLRSAILDRFCVHSLDALANHDQPAGQYPLTGQEVMEWLRHTNAFITPQDNEGHWFKYHALFRELLLRELKQHHSAEAITALHRQVGQWFSEKGLWDEALRHLLAAGEFSSAIELVAGQRHQLMNAERWDELERWIRWFPDEVAANDPILLITLAHLPSTHGRKLGLESYAARAARLVAAAPADWPLASEVRGELAYLSALVAAYTGDAATAIAQGSEALELLPAQAQFLRSITLGAQATGYQTSGAYEQSLLVINEALQDPLWPATERAKLLLYRCMVAFLESDLVRVQRSADESMRLALKYQLWDTLSQARYESGMAHYLRNELALAAPHWRAMVEKPALSTPEYLSDAACALARIYHVQRQPDQAAEVLRSVTAYCEEMGSTFSLDTLRAFEVELALDQGDVALARRLSQAVNFDPNRPFWRYYVSQLTPVKLWLAEGTAEGVQQALVTLQQMDDYLHRTNRKIFRIDVLALQALAYAAQGDEPKAYDKLTEALRLGEPSGFIRNFVDLGPSLAKLLSELSHRGVAPEYITRILAAFPSTPVSPRTIGQAQLIEPLTGREFEILTLLAQRLSNKEIAGRLSISAGTVKRHTINIYQKLQVHDRQHAIGKARSLGLLARE